MDETTVVELMKGSRSQREWDINCETVRGACKGFPDFWYKAIVTSDVEKDTRAKFGKTLITA